MAKLIYQIINSIRILFFFGLACCLVPVLIISAIFVHIINKVCLNCMNLMYPCYEFSTSKKIRTLIDTARNSGIFHFLLELNGPCDFPKIKENYFNHLIEKLNKTDGELRFPKLRQKLISIWGLYAWDRDDSKFDINNHIILCPRKYRGRLVTENNVQDCINELVTKYIPSEHPQWQIIVIPVANSASTSISEYEPNLQDENFYILIKLHHLLLAEETHLHISEILMLNSENSTALKDYENSHNSELPKLTNFVERPIHIPNLWNQISMNMVNRWNEFIYRYDPLESPDVDKKQQIQCISKLISIIFITIVTVCTDFMRGYKNTNDHIKYKLRYFLTLFKRESCKRNLTIQSVVDSLSTSLNPINLVKNTIQLIWYISAATAILSPYYLIKEILALKDIIFTGHTVVTETFTGFISVYIPLIYHAVVEVVYIAVEIIKAPANIYEELFISKSKERNALQAKSFSGRKVVSFSKSIDLEVIRNRLNLDELGETEFIYNCLGGALKKYLEIFNNEYNIPEMLNVTCRSISKDYFVEKYNKTDHIGGVVFLQIPLTKPTSDQIKHIHGIFNRVREKQIAIYLISMGQTKFDILTMIIPDVLMKIFINYFSYNYPVTITEIYGSTNSSKLQTIWGQNVKDLLFFRPPQSKTCLSLNIHRFGSSTRLAVIADTQLAPEHTKIAIYWENFMEGNLVD